MSSPRFISGLKAINQPIEGGFVTLQALYEPKTDRNLKFDWFLNDQPLSRLSDRHEFYSADGYCSLKISRLTAADSGEIKLKLSNYLGSVCSCTNLVVLSKFANSNPGLIQYSSSSFYKSSSYDTLRQNNQLISEQRKQHEFNQQTQQTRTHPNSSLSNFSNQTQQNGYSDHSLSTTQQTQQFTHPPSQQPSQPNAQPLSSQSTQQFRSMQNLSTSATSDTKVGRKPPAFACPLYGPGELVQGQPAYFETKLDNYRDPTVRVEWLLNGRPLPSAHRYKTYFDFGYIALTILEVDTADQGVYECRVTSKYGTVSVSKSLTVKPNAPLDYSKLTDLDLELIKSKPELLDLIIKPWFVRHLTQPKNVFVERSNLHLEGKLFYLSEYNLQINCFHNGKPLKVGHRFSLRFDFNCISLDILDLQVEDSGVYEIVCSNEAGECRSSAFIRVVPEQVWQQNNRYRLDRQRQPVPPKFLKTSKQIKVKEGETVHIEAQIDSYVYEDDLKVEWFKDGQPLQSASRITTFFNFGYSYLTINAAEPRDAGVYTCTITSKHGKATFTAQLQVEYYREAKHDRTTKQQEEFENFWRKYTLQYKESKDILERRQEEEIGLQMKPKFTSPLYGTRCINERKTIQLEAKLIPVNFDNLLINWFKNGKPLDSGSRITMFKGFGTVSLTIKDANTFDSGVYTVEARNRHQLDRVSANVTVIDRDNESRFSSVKEQTLHGKPAVVNEREPESGPQFQPFTLSSQVFSEKQTLHLESRIGPVGDRSMRVNWYFNGRLLEEIEEKVRIVYDYDYVSLTIYDLSTSDSGCYECRAQNAKSKSSIKFDVTVLSENEFIRWQESESHSQIDRQFKSTFDSDTRIHQIESSRSKISRLPPRTTQSTQQIYPPPKDSLYSTRDAFSRDTLSRDTFTRETTAPKGGILKKDRSSTLSTLTSSSKQPISYLRETKEFKSSDFNYYEDKVYEEQGSKRKLAYDRSTDFDSVYDQSTAEQTSSATTTKLFKQQRTDKYSSQPLSDRSTNQQQSLIDQISKQDRFTRQQSADSYSQFSRQEIEDKSYLKRIEEEIIELNLRPKFLSFLYGPRRIQEKKQVKFEAILVPKKREHVQVVWLKDGKPIENENLRALFDEGRAVLIIDRVTRLDEGTYTVCASNALGEDRVSANLEVLDQFSTEPELYYREEYESTISITELKRKSEQEQPVLLGPARSKENEVVHFETRIQAVPGVTYEWLLNGNALPKIDKFRTFADDKGYSSLTITQAKRENSGIYELKVKDQQGESLSIRKYLEVHPAYYPQASGARPKRQQPYQVPETVFGPQKAQSIQELSINSKRGKISDVDFDTEPKIPPKLMPRTSSRGLFGKKQPPGKLDERHLVLYQVHPDKRETIQFTGSKHLSETQLSSTSKFEISQMETEKFFSQPEIYDQAGQQSTAYYKQQTSQTVQQRPFESLPTSLVDDSLPAQPTTSVVKEQFQSTLSNIHEIPKNVSPDSDQKLRTSPTKKKKTTATSFKVVRKEHVDVSALDEFDKHKVPAVAPVDRPEFSRIQLKPTASQSKPAKPVDYKPVQFTVSQPTLQIFDTSSKTTRQQDTSSFAQTYAQKSVFEQKSTTQSDQSLLSRDRAFDRTGTEQRSDQRVYDVRDSRYSQQDLTTGEEKTLMRYEEIQIYKDNSNVAYRVAQKSRYPMDQQPQEQSFIGVDRKIGTQIDKKVVSKMDTKTDKLIGLEFDQKLVDHTVQRKDIQSTRSTISRQVQDQQVFAPAQPLPASVQPVPGPMPAPLQPMPAPVQPLPTTLPAPVQQLPTTVSQTSSRKFFERRETSVQKKFELPTLKPVSRIKPQPEKQEISKVELKPYRKPSIEVVNVPRGPEEDDSDKIPRPTAESIREFEYLQLSSQKKETLSDTQSIILERISKPKVDLQSKVRDVKSPVDLPRPVKTPVELQSTVREPMQPEFYSTIKQTSVQQQPQSTSVEVISGPRVTPDYRTVDQSKSVEYEVSKKQIIDQAISTVSAPGAKPRTPERRFRSEEIVSLVEPTQPKMFETVQPKTKRPSTKLESKILKKQVTDYTIDTSGTRIDESHVSTIDIDRRRAAEQISETIGPLVRTEKPLGPKDHETISLIERDRVVSTKVLPSGKQLSEISQKIETQTTAKSKLTYELYESKTKIDSVSRIGEKKPVAPVRFDDQHISTIDIDRRTAVDHITRAVSPLVTAPKTPERKFRSEEIVSLIEPTRPTLFEGVQPKTKKPTSKLESKILKKEVSEYKIDRPLPAVPLDESHVSTIDIDRRRAVDQISETVAPLVRAEKPLGPQDTISLVERDRVVSTKVLPSGKQLSETVKKIETRTTDTSKLTYELYESTSKVEQTSVKSIQDTRRVPEKFRSDETISLVEPRPEPKQLLETVPKTKKPGTKLESKILKKEFVDKDHYDQVVSTIEQGEAITRTKLPQEAYRKPKSPVHFASETQLDRRTDLRKDTYEESVSLIRKQQIIQKSGRLFTSEDEISRGPRMTDESTVSKIELLSSTGKVKLPDTIQQVKTPLHTRDEVGLIGEKPVPVQHPLKTIPKPVLHTKDEVSYDETAPVTSQLATRLEVHRKDTRETKLYDETLSRIQLDVDKRKAVDQISKTVAPLVSIERVPERLPERPRDYEVTSSIRKDETKVSTIGVDRRTPVDLISESIAPQVTIEKLPLGPQETISLVERDRVVSTKPLPSGKKLSETVQKIETRTTDKSKLTYELYESKTKIESVSRIGEKKPVVPVRFDDQQISTIDIDRRTAVDQITRAVSPLVEKPRTPERRFRSDETLSLVEPARPKPFEGVQPKKPTTQLESRTMRKDRYEIDQTISTRIDESKVSTIERVKTPVDLQSTVREPMQPEFYSTIKHKSIQQQPQATSVELISTPKVTTDYRTIEQISTVVGAPKAPERKFRSEEIVSLIEPTRPKLFEGVQPKTKKPTTKLESKILKKEVSEYKIDRPLPLEESHVSTIDIDRRRAVEQISETIAPLVRTEKLPGPQDYETISLVEGDRVVSTKVLPSGKQLSETVRKIETQTTAKSKLTYELYEKKTKIDSVSRIGEKKPVSPVRFDEQQVSTIDIDRRTAVDQITRAVSPLVTAPKTPERKFRSEEIVSLIEPTRPTLFDGVQPKTKKPTTKLESKILKKQVADYTIDTSATRIDESHVSTLDIERRRAIDQISETIAPLVRTEKPLGPQDYETISLIEKGRVVSTKVLPSGKQLSETVRKIETRTTDKSKLTYEAIKIESVSRIEKKPTFKPTEFEDTTVSLIEGDKVVSQKVIHGRVPTPERLPGPTPLVTDTKKLAREYISKKVDELKQEERIYEYPSPVQEFRPEPLPIGE